MGCESGLHNSLAGRKARLPLPPTSYTYTRHRRVAHFVYHSPVTSSCHDSLEHRTMGVTLPPEILSIICDLCTTPPGLCGTHDCNKYAISFCCIKKACMALRLVGRDWNAASTPFVFDHIKLRLFPSSVERFTQLCESELAKHVKIRLTQILSVRAWTRCLSPMHRL